ncbi:MAG: hypothetical protein V2J12_00560 [Gammaproteobacteria bacterium]|nr:hypothetical protein [Gammaproteobacteria bacterium]
MKKRVNRYSADIESPLATLCYGLFSLLVGAWLVWDALNFRLVTFAADAAYWEYVAVLREWLANPAAPANPQVAATSLSARFMPYFWLLATAGRTLDLTAVQLMAVSTVVNFALLVIGLKLFLQAYFRNGWAPFVGLVVLLTFAGTGLFEANVYQLRNLFYVAGYPASFAFGLSLVAFWLTLAVLRDDLRPVLAVPVLGVVAALLFLSDPLTGVFGIVGCFLLAVTEPLGSRRTVGLALGALATGMVAAELWPYFSVWKLTLGLYPGAAAPALADAAALTPVERFAAQAWAHPLYNPTFVLGTLGLSLLGLPLVGWMLLTRQHWFIVLGTLSMLLPYVLNLFIPVTDGPAYLLLAAVYLQLAVVWGWLTLIEAWDQIPRPMLARPALLASAVTGAAVVAGNLWMAALEFDGRTLQPGTLSVVSQRTDDAADLFTQYRALLDPVADDAVVLAAARTGWVVPAVKGKVVSLLHANPLLSDQRERLEATEDFFSRPASDLRRVQVAQDYAAEYVIVDAANSLRSAELDDWLQRFAQPVNQSGELWLYRLTPAVQAIKLPEPAPALAAENSAATTARPTDDAPAPAKPARSSRPAAASTPPPAEPEPAAEDEAPRSYGAPIAAPILDPERHGA